MFMGIFASYTYFAEIAKGVALIGVLPGTVAADILLVISYISQRSSSMGVLPAVAEYFKLLF